MSELSGQSAVARPTELAITLAALPNRYDIDGWTYADNVAHRLRDLGFDVSAQRVAAWLLRMSKVDAPWVETQESPWGAPRRYRVTRYGRCDIENKIPKLRVWT